MINTVLELVTTSLNRYLKTRLEFSEHLAVVSSLVEPDGTMVPETDNKLAISLVSIERDTSANTPLRWSGDHKTGHKVSPKNRLVRTILS